MKALKEITTIYMMEENNISSKVIQDLKLKNNSIKNYIDTLTPLEYKALAISIRELETSFSLEKSIGYIAYCKSINTIDHKNN